MQLHQLDLVPGDSVRVGRFLVTVVAVDGGLVQLQQKVLAALDKINGMPIEPMMKQATETLRASEKTIAEAQKTLSELNVLLSSKEFKALPKDMQSRIRSSSKRVT